MYQHKVDPGSWIGIQYNCLTNLRHSSDIISSKIPTYGTRYPPPTVPVQYRTWSLIILIEIRLAFLLRRRHHWALTYVELHRLIPDAEGRVVHLIHIRYSSNFPIASRWRGLISPLTLTSERSHCHIYMSVILDPSSARQKRSTCSSSCGTPVRVPI